METILITGAASGIGKASKDYFLDTTNLSIEEKFWISFQSDSIYQPSIRKAVTPLASIKEVLHFVCFL